MAGFGWPGFMVQLHMIVRFDSIISSLLWPIQTRILSTTYFHAKANIQAQHILLFTVKPRKLTSMTTKRTRTAKQTQNRRTSPKVSDNSTRLRAAPQTQENVDDDSSREEEPPLTTTAPATTTERAGDSNEENGSKATVMVNGGNSVSSPLTLATGLVSAAEAKKICERRQDGVIIKLTKFIRNFAWPEMKFSPDSKARERLFLAAMRRGEEKCPEGLREEQFVAYFYEKVSKIFSKMRHNAQTCARQRYLSKSCNLKECQNNLCGNLT